MAATLFRINYNGTRIRESSKNIVDILTDSFPSSVDILESGSHSFPEDFAVNYGDSWSPADGGEGRPHFPRGIEYGGMLFRIDKRKKAVVGMNPPQSTKTCYSDKATSSSFGLFYDKAKIPLFTIDEEGSREIRRFMFLPKTMELAIEEVLVEFALKGYDIEMF